MSVETAETYRRVTVGREVAKQWLKLNRSNRPIRTDQVDTWSRTMLAGQWQFTGEAITFNHDGYLSNGQHRLLGLIKATDTVPDLTIDVLVVTGVAPTAQMVMDSGAKRSAADALLFAGHQYGSTLAAMARVALSLEKGWTTRKVGLSHTEVLAWVESNKSADKAAFVTNRWRKIPGIGTGVLAYTYMILCAIDPHDAERFFSDLDSLKTAGHGDPRAALLRRLTTAKANKERIPWAAQVSMIYRAWNAVRKGKDMSIMKVSVSGDAVEIPRPI